MNIGLKTLKSKYQDQSLLPDLNFNFEEIRRAFRKIESNDVDTWNTYTPTLASTGVAPSNAGLGWSARYKRYGTTGDLKIGMQVSAAMAAAPGTGSYTWTLPPGWTATPGYEQTGTGTFLRVGVVRWPAIAVVQPSPTFGPPNNVAYNIASDNGIAFGAGGPGRALAWVAGDYVILEMRLELVQV